MAVTAAAMVWNSERVSSADSAGATDSVEEKVTSLGVARSAPTMMAMNRYGTSRCGQVECDGVTVTGVPAARGFAGSTTGVTAMSRRMSGRRSQTIVTYPRRVGGTAGAAVRCRCEQRITARARAAR